MQLTLSVQLTPCPATHLCSALPLPLYRAQLHVRHLKGGGYEARGENQKWQSHRCLLEGPRRGRKCYITPAFSGVPNAKRGEKIRGGYLTPSFWGAQKRAEVLHNPASFGRAPRFNEIAGTFRWGNLRGVCTALTSNNRDGAHLNRMCILSSGFTLTNPQPENATSNAQRGWFGGGAARYVRQCQQRDARKCVHGAAHAAVRRQTGGARWLTTNAQQKQDTIQTGEMLVQIIRLLPRSHSFAAGTRSHFERGRLTAPDAALSTTVLHSRVACRQRLRRGTCTPIMFE